MKSLAIVIPYFKYEFFDKCLESLAHQTSKDFKVYIGDDSSPSIPTKILNRYKGKLDFNYKRFNQNFGSRSLVSHWSRCIDMVEDEKWLMILGDDDKLGTECIKDFLESKEEIKKLKISVVRFATIKIDENDRETSERFTHPERETSVKFLFRKLKGETRSSLSEYIFLKEVVDNEKFKELPLAWHTDDLAILEFSNFGEVYSINTSTVYFRNSGLNISTLTTNLREKNRASFMFYYIILKGYSHYFTEKEKGILFYRLEKTFLNDKKNPKFYLSYFWLRKQSFSLPDTINFAKKFYYSVKTGKTMKKITKSE